MDKLIEAAKGVGVQGVLAIMITAASCLIWIQARQVPQDLILLNGIIVAFYFGNKAGERRATNAEPPLPPPAL